LEVTVVTAIAGVLLALAVPRFVHLRDASSVRAAMGELGAVFSAARQEAITRRARVAVVFDGSAGTVELRMADQTLLRRSLGLAYGVSLASTRDSAVYDPRGMGYGVSNLTVTVRRGVIVDTLTVSRLGRARW
jgi:Tfp pilus assembly protein FimT